MMSTPIQRSRWRLVMGEGSQDTCGDCLSDEDKRREECMGFLYDREYGGGRNVRRKGGAGSSKERSAGLGESSITVPDWINHVHELFPSETIERLEKDALERYELEEMVTNPKLLANVKPSMPLLKAVLRTKHLMNQQVLAAARRLVRQVVEQLLEKLARDIRNPFTGAIDRRRRSSLKIAKNFDIKSTLAHNLKNYNPQTRRVVIETPLFHSRVRRQSDKWQIIVVVDQSGSMVDSVIHSAIMASIFFGIKSLKPHLVLFDTNVVDVTQDCTDPVETLMKVQLGGGTDIGRALEYAASLVDNPSRTIVVLITDFYEGGSAYHLFSVTRHLVESGVKLLGLAAIDEEANPSYDHAIAAKMVSLGASVAAMTPGELAQWVAEKVQA